MTAGGAGPSGGAPAGKQQSAIELEASSLKSFKIKTSAGTYSPSKSSIVPALTESETSQER